MTGLVSYDEFSLFHENAAEFGIAWKGPPKVSRRKVVAADGRSTSGLVWGDHPPQIAFLHGGGQNAHTWDTVALALGEPLIAVDLPGHGHSDDGANGSFDLSGNAAAIADYIRGTVSHPVHLVGMSLGGVTALAAADAYPDLFRSLLLVDVTPAVSLSRSSRIREFINGPETFRDFDELLARTVEYNPTRTESSLRRGILHNAEQLPDGTWRWRHARAKHNGVGARPVGDLWEAVSRLKMPVCLARGMRADSVVDDADEAELLRRQPSARIEHFEKAGHSLQGDTPVEFAALVRDFTKL